MAVDRRHLALLAAGLVLVRLLLWWERSDTRGVGDLITRWTGDPVSRLFLIPVVGAVMGVGVLLIRLGLDKEGKE